MGAEEKIPATIHEPRWIAELDYLRGFAIIAVVMNHAAVFALVDKSADVVLANLLLITLSGFGVTTFFFISGMVLANKYRPPVSMVGFFKRRFGTIIPPYVVASTLFIIYISILSGAPSFDSIVVYYLTGSAAHSLWFIVVLLEFYLFFPLIIALYDRFEKKGHELTILASCFIIQIVWNSLSVLLEESLSMLVLDRIFLSYLAFFVLGIYAARNIDRVEPWIKKISITALISILLITFIATVGIVYYCIQTEVLGAFSVFNFYFATLPAWPALLLLAYKVSFKLSKNRGFFSESIRKMGRAAYGIYLLHMFVLSAIVAVLVRLGINWNNVLFYPIEVFALVGLSYLLVRLLTKMPRSEWIVGK